MKDDKELDEIFEEGTRANLTKVVRKAKWHSILRNTAISIVAAIIVLIGGTIFVREYTYSLETPIQIAVDSFYKIAYPNEYIGTMARYHDILSGKNTYTTYKSVEGKVVHTGQHEYSYGLFNDGSWIGTESPGILGQTWSEEDLKLPRYNALGQREMVFFYPFIKYHIYRNDLSLLDEIPDDKYMEMALSFDKSYTIDEVNKLFPKNITLKWYWVDDLSKEEKEQHKTKTQVALNGKSTVMDNPDVRSEKTAYGIKIYDENGQPYPQIETNFIWALHNGKETKSKYTTEFERVYNNIAGTDAKLTKDDFGIEGVVVTGNKQMLESLKGLPFIKASSLGVVTEKY